MPQKTIMIMAGGTGGHVFPALAVAQWLKLQGWRIVWLGAKTGMEADLVPKHGFEMAWVRFSGLRGKGLLRMLTLPLNLLVAFWQSLTALRRNDPNVVLGMGGYITFPGGMMAVLLRYPLIIQEQNSVAGLSNKVLARVADKVLVAFPNAIANAQWSGNPLRAEVTSLPSPEQRYASREGNLRVLILGGSLGAQALNETVPKALALIDPTQRPQVTHQAGVKHIDTLRRNYTQAGVEAELLPFIHNMAERYTECDLVICRAGAMTVAELSAVGVASILVPFPHAVDDHQTTNARYLADQQAAILIQQSDLNPERLADLLIGMTREKLLEMAMRARALAKPDATETVARACMELAR